MYITQSTLRSVSAVSMGSGARHRFKPPNPVVCSLRTSVHSFTPRPSSPTRKQRHQDLDFRHSTDHTQRYIVAMGADLSIFEYKEAFAPQQRSRDGTIHRSWLVTNSPNVDSTVFAQVCPGSDLVAHHSVNSATLRSFTPPNSVEDVYVTLVVQLEQPLVVSLEGARRYVRGLLAAFRCLNQGAIIDRSPTSLLWGVDLSQAISPLSNQDLQVLATAWAVESSLVAEPNLPCCTLQYIAFGDQPGVTPEGLCRGLRKLGDARSDKKVDGFNRPVCAGLPLLTTIRVGALGACSARLVFDSEPFLSTCAYLLETGITVEMETATTQSSETCEIASPKTVWRQPPAALPTSTQLVVAAEPFQCNGRTSPSPSQDESVPPAAQPPGCAPSPPRPVIIRRKSGCQSLPTIPSPSSAAQQPPPNVYMRKASFDDPEMSSPSCVESVTDHSSDCVGVHEVEDDVVVVQSAPPLDTIHIITQASFLCNEEHYRCRAHTASLLNFSDEMLEALYAAAEHLNAVARWGPHLNQLSEAYDNGVQQLQALHTRGSQWLHVLCLLVESVERMRESALMADPTPATLESLSVQGIFLRLTSTKLWSTLRDVLVEFSEALETSGQGIMDPRSNTSTKLSVRSVQFCLAHCEYRLRIVNEDALQLAEHTHGRICTAGWAIACRMGDVLSRRIRANKPSHPVSQPQILRHPSIERASPPRTTTNAAAPDDGRCDPESAADPPQEEEFVLDAKPSKPVLPHYMKRLAPIPRQPILEDTAPAVARTTSSIPHQRTSDSPLRIRSTTASPSPPQARRSTSPTRMTAPEPPLKLTVKDMRALLIGNGEEAASLPAPTGKKSRQTRTVSPVRDEMPSRPIPKEPSSSPVRQPRELRELYDLPASPEATLRACARSSSPALRKAYQDPTASPQMRPVGRPRMTATFEARLGLLNKKKKEEAKGKQSMLDLNSKRFAAVASKVVSHRPANEAPRTLAPPPRPKERAESPTHHKPRGVSTIGAMRRQHQQATRETVESPTRYRRNFAGKVPRYQQPSPARDDEAWDRHVGDLDESPAPEQPPLPLAKMGVVPLESKRVQRHEPSPSVRGASPIPQPPQPTPQPTPVHVDITIPEKLFPQPASSANIAYFTHREGKENDFPHAGGVEPAVISRCVLNNITTILKQNSSGHQQSYASDFNGKSAASSSTSNSLAYFTKRN